MLVTPALALLTLVFNFCALLHIANHRNGLSTKTGSRWQVLDYGIYPLQETTDTVYKNSLDIVAPLPPTSSSVYSSTLRSAEWVYRSSAVRILDLVDGSSKVQTISGIDSPPSLSQPLPSPTRPTDFIVPVVHLPPTLTSSTDPATFEPFPIYDPSIQTVTTSSVAQTLGLTGFISCLVYTLVFIWMKNRHSRRRVFAKRPRLTCNVNCKAPAEVFHSLLTVTPIPSYPGSEAKFSESRSKGSSDRSRGSRIDFPAPSRNFPVAVTGSDGKALFNAEIKFSSNRVVTELSGTTSTVSFSINVIASLDVPPASEWYMPGKEDGSASPQADDSTFLLLVRGLSDRVPLAEEFQASDRTSEPEEDILFVDQTPPSGAPTMVSDREVEDMVTSEVPHLDSPMCPITIPIHYRGFSSFETALINSGTEARRASAHREHASHRSGARTNIRPKDVHFPWLKDIYTCGDDHLDGCTCEETLAEGVHDENYYPYRHVISKILCDHDATPEFDRDTRSEERGSGMSELTYTVSPGLSVRSEMPPTSISSPAEPRLTAHSDPLLADGKELAGLDSTVTLMPSFSVGSPELSSRCRSSGISTSAEFSDGARGEQSVSPKEDNTETRSTGECIGMTCFENGIRSPPSPVVPAQVNSLLDALEPVLARYTSPSSPEEPALVHPSSKFNRLGSTPLQYSPSSVGAHGSVRPPATPNCDDWVGESMGVVNDADPELTLEVEL